jgi:HAD superfamily hydrolase (TIGR01484 family)
VHVIVATTRNPDFVGTLCRSLQINDPIICANGAQVWGSPDGPVWAYHCIPQEVALAIAQWADAHNWELSTTIGSMTYWRQRPGQVPGQIAPNRTIVPTNSDGIVGEPVRILAHQLEAIESIRSLCQSRFSNQCHAETYYNPDGTVHSLGILALRADKGTALALVLDRLGAEKERVLAIGDNVNDLAMFPYARVRVAMANAVDEVKQQASVIAPSNDDEGVAWALERFVLGEL